MRWPCSVLRSTEEGGPSRAVPGRPPALHSGPMVVLVHLVQSHQRGHAAAQGFVPPAVDRRPTRKERRLKRSVHRGPHGASLETPRAGRRATGGLRSVWAALVCSGVAPPRRREALGPAGPAGRGGKPQPVTGTPASRAPSILFEGAEEAKETKTRGVPGTFSNNTGDHACLEDSESRTRKVV